SVRDSVRELLKGIIQEFDGLAKKLLGTELVAGKIDVDAEMKQFESLGDRKLHTVTPNDLYLLAVFLYVQGSEATASKGQVVFDGSPLAFSPADVIAAISKYAPLGTSETAVSHIEQALKAAQAASAGQAAELAPQQPATGDDHKASHAQVATTSDNKDVSADDSPRQPATGDDKDASQKQVATASDNKSASTDDASQQPAAGGDEEASQKQAATTSDDKNARTD